MPSLFEQIGPELLERAITEFYRRAFIDPIIGHFFLRKDQNELVQKQLAFTRNLLGNPEPRYAGRPLREVHKPLNIRPPHFRRRAILLREILDEMGLDPQLRDAWLALEEQLKPVILRSQTSCRE